MGILFNDYDQPRMSCIVAGIAALVLGAFGTCQAIGNKWKVSEGDRVGMVNKISEKGVFWNTWEGQMALEGVSSHGESLGANTWDFSIDNYFTFEQKDRLIKQLQDSMNSGQKVKINYQEMMQTWPWRSDTGYLIQSVTPLGIGTRSAESAGTGVANPAYKPRQTEFGIEVQVDGRNYYLKHDDSGKLRVTELKSVNE